MTPGEGVYFPGARPPHALVDNTYPCPHPDPSIAAFPVMGFGFCLLALCFICT